MLSSKRALVPRRQGTGRQTTFRSFAVTSRDFDFLREQTEDQGNKENAGGTLQNAPQLSPVQIANREEQQIAADAAPKQPAVDLHSLNNMAPSIPGEIVVIGAVTDPAAGMRETTATRLLCGLVRPWRIRGSGRTTKKYKFSSSIEGVEHAEQKHRAEVAAAAAAAEAAIRAAAEAAARAEEEARAVAEAAARAEEAAKAAAERAAQAEAEAKAEEEAAAERARVEAEAESAARAAKSAAETPAAAHAKQHTAATPGSCLTTGWSPIEGVPEMHTRPPTRRRSAAAAAAAAAATPIASLGFTPMEGVPETARGFRRSSARAGKGATPASKAYTPVEGVPEKDGLYQRTPFQRQLQRAAADTHTSPQGVPDLVSPAAAAAREDDAGVTAADMAAALQQVDSMVAGIVSASPNTPSTHPLPVYLTSIPRSKAAAAAAASVYRHKASKPGHMNVAIQASPGAAVRCSAAQQFDSTPLQAAADAAANMSAAGGAVATGGQNDGADATAIGAAGDGVAAALWDDDVDDYAGAGGDDDDSALDGDPGASDIAGGEVQEEQQQGTDADAGSRGVAAVNSSGAGTLSPPPRLTPEPSPPAPEGGDATTAGATAAARRKYQSMATPREGRQAKNRKSLAGDGLILASDGRRVSKRQRRKPLEYWRNESKQYVRDHRSLPTVTRYVSVTPDPVWPAPTNPQVKKARTKLNQQQKRMQQDREEEEQMSGPELDDCAAGSSAAAAAAAAGAGKSRPAGKGKKRSKH